MDRADTCKRICSSTSIPCFLWRCCSLLFAVTVHRLQEPDEQGCDQLSVSAISAARGIDLLGAVHGRQRKVLPDSSSTLRRYPSSRKLSLGCRSFGGRASAHDLLSIIRSFPLVSTPLEIKLLRVRTCMYSS
ncbi:hypothetical protein NE237_017179 [Protea cynaroides]|uniref:Secreted protein n=1 Tax=Protea cynaroides TaxID=273540 RepID=A0A9Q0K7J7_9MAGN|nr:hypothetical protein NE237_017179 [Protea cynaroides]